MIAGAVLTRVASEFIDRANEACEDLCGKLSVRPFDLIYRDDIINFVISGQF